MIFPNFCDLLWFVVIFLDLLWFFLICCDLLSFVVICYHLLWFVIIFPDLLWFVMISPELLWFFLICCDLLWFVTSHNTKQGPYLSHMSPVIHPTIQICVRIGLNCCSYSWYQKFGLVWLCLYMHTGHLARSWWSTRIPRIPTLQKLSHS